MPDLVFSVNRSTQDLRFGDPATGALSNIQPLGFACARLVVLAGQRYVYVTGNKSQSGVPHAWLAVFDTCANAVVKEVDLGVGFAGQAAVPGGVGGIRAYVAVSQAVGSTDTGPDGGSNRVEILNIVNPADPMRLTPAFAIPGTPYGTYHIIWSVQRNRLFTTHRGSGQIFSIDPLGGSVQPEVTLTQQPTGMALSRNGLILYVGRRLAGDVVAFDISGPQISPGISISLPRGISGSAIYLAVDAMDRVVATSAQRPHNPPNAPNPNPNPIPGQVFVIDPLSANPQMPKIVDTQGTWLGQPAPTPDGLRVFVPRGDQNDLAKIDPAPNPPTMAQNLVQVGHSPTDAVAVDHVAGQTLQATPAMIQADCTAPQQVTIRAYDACGTERNGVPIQRVGTSGTASVTPQQQNTPATFDVQCQSYGMATLRFTTTNFPFSSLSVPVDCQCLEEYCLTFYSTNPAGVTPTNLGGFVSVQILNPGVFQGPQVFGNLLHLRGGTLRFQMPANTPARNLIVKYTRHDSLSQPEVATVTHGNQTTSVSNTMAGLTQADHEIICPFQDISQWIFAGGVETRIREICFEAQPGLLPPGP